MVNAMHIWTKNIVYLLRLSDVKNRFSTHCPHLQSLWFPTILTYGYYYYDYYYIVEKFSRKVSLDASQIRAKADNAMSGISDYSFLRKYV